MKEELHENIDNENEINRILWDHAMRWFCFGMGVGGVVTSLLFVFIK